MPKWLYALIGVVALVILWVLTRPDAASGAPPYTVTTFASGLEHPWAIAFLPDGRALVTERPGRLRLVGADGKISAPLAGVPAVFAEGQGGLLDVALDPGFARNKVVYISYAEAGADGKAGTAVARAILEQDTIANVRVIFRQQPKVKGPNHWGSRLAFAGDGTVFVTLGERFDYRDRAQDLTSHLGKVVRIRGDGGVPNDNPFIANKGALPEIWSLGHRNVQGAAIHPDTGELWAHEHGARGGDEINIVRKGRNYGWPVIAYGKNYNFTTIGEGKSKPGMEQPLHYWDPSIAPSGMLFYTGDAFPAWKGNLFVGALAGQALHRLQVAGNKVMREEKLLAELNERIRDVAQDAKGYIYVVTDSEQGRILRLSPAS